METVFDYNITDEERKYIGISEKEHYLRHISEDKANWGLAFLFNKRGDKKRMKECADKLPPDLKLDFYRTITHP